MPCYRELAQYACAIEHSKLNLEPWTLKELQDGAETSHHLFRRCGNFEPCDSEKATDSPHSASGSVSVKVSLRNDEALLYFAFACRDEVPCSAFSSLCCGVEFLPFPTAQERAKSSPPLYQRPALHTFWCACSVREHWTDHNSYMDTLAQP